MAIQKLRRALRDDPKKPRFILTVPRKGFRFVGTIDAAERDRSAIKESPKAELSCIPEMPGELRVGREQELARLRERFVRANAGRRQIVFVTSEPGIGKTTVVQSFLASFAHDRETYIAREQCIEQYGAGEAYMPVLEAFTRLCRDADGDSIVEILVETAPS